MFHAARVRLSADILSGLALSKEIRRRVGIESQRLLRPPCLAVVLVGDRPDSLRYVKHKRRAAAECGIVFRLIQLPDTVSQQRLHRELVAVNSDDSVDGVLLQLPLPPHLRARPALFHIHPGKDVDGLHPLNAGNLFLRDSSPLADAFTDPSRLRNAAVCGPHFDCHAVDESLVVANNEGSFSSIARQSHERRYFIPCTALAVRSLIVSYLSRTDTFFHASSPHHDAAKQHLHAVIVNSSMVVGVPTMALLQKERGFSVTMCNRHTPLDAIRRLSRGADVFITAYGEANVFDAAFVKDGAIVIDVAINERPVAREVDREHSTISTKITSSTNSTSSTSSTKTTTASSTTTRRKTDDANETTTPSRLCGDVDFDSVKKVARAITPVPGGVGPLTVAHLMQNVLKAARLRRDTRLYYNSIYASFVKMYGETHSSSSFSFPSPSFSSSSSFSSSAEAETSPEEDEKEKEKKQKQKKEKENAEEEEEEMEDFTDNGSFDC